MAAEMQEVDRGVHYSKTHYRAWWNHYARMGRLASRLFWILLPVGIFTLFFAGLADLYWVVQGACFVATGLIATMAILLQVDRMRSVEQLKEIASFARRISTPSHPAETFLYDEKGNKICGGGDFLPPPWGFPLNGDVAKVGELVAGSDAVGLFEPKNPRREGLVADLSQLAGDPNDAMM